jgi:putative sigma-54 modulation protein
MKFIITGRHIHITDALRDRIHKKIGKLDKFFHEDTEAHVTLEVEKERQMVEVTIPFHGIILRAEEENHDMYVAIDKTIDVLERQIRKYKTRISKKLKANAFHGETISTTTSTASMKDVEEEGEFSVVKTKRFAVKPMNVEEAILQMNLLGHQFFVFSNADSEDVNVVYKRKDGDYGLIEPKF